MQLGRLRLGTKSCLLLYTLIEIPRDESLAQSVLLSDPAQLSQSTKLTASKTTTTTNQLDASYIATLFVAIAEPLRLAGFPNAQLLQWLLLHSSLVALPAPREALELCEAGKSRANFELLQVVVVFVLPFARPDKAL